MTPIFTLSDMAASWEKEVMENRFVYFKSKLLLEARPICYIFICRRIQTQHVVVVSISDPGLVKPVGWQGFFFNKYQERGGEQAGSEPECSIGTKLSQSDNNRRL